MAADRETREKRSLRSVSFNRAPDGKDMRIFSGDRMQGVLEKCALISGVEGPVLITGETGTGKSTLSREVHALSKRANGPFVARGCGEFDPGTLEATLFGHTEDAYTGARSAQDGVLATANGGTLVLDDIDYLPLKYQSRLLRFLDDGTFFRLGEPGTPIVVDVRLILTTNKDLHLRSERGLFLPDLLYRLNRWQLNLPPLRAYPGDIPGLAEFFVGKFQAQLEAPASDPWFFTESSLELLQKAQWRGNLRELQETIENIALFANTNRRPITFEDVSRVLLDKSRSPQRGLVRTNSEQSDTERLHRTLINTAWNVSLTSKLLGCSRTTVYKQMREHGWSRPDNLSNR